MAKTKATHHVVFILAQIHGPGAIDMLRYDTCCPASEHESGLMERAFGGAGATWVILKRFVALGAPKEPNAARWNSFNVPCVEQAFESYQAAEDCRDAILHHAAQAAP
jgi:hypothetical protein